MHFAESNSFGIDTDGLGVASSFHGHCAAWTASVPEHGGPAPPWGHCSRPSACSPASARVEEVRREGASGHHPRVLAGQRGRWGESGWGGGAHGFGSHTKGQEPRSCLLGFWMQNHFTSGGLALGSLPPAGWGLPKGLDHLIRLCVSRGDSTRPPCGLSGDGQVQAPAHRGIFPFSPPPILAPPNFCLASRCLLRQLFLQEAFLGCPAPPRTAAPVPPEPVTP